MADQMRSRVTPEQVEAARSRLAEAGFPIPATIEANIGLIRKHTRLTGRRRREERTGGRG
jgi:hypothetical protein